GKAFIPNLVALGHEEKDVRRAARIRDLPVEALPLIERFAGESARLLVISDQAGERMVEVAHEALFSAWPLLKGWIEADKEFLAGKRQLDLALRDWLAAVAGEADAASGGAPATQSAEAQSAPQSERALLGGLMLDKGRSWLTTHASQLTAAERDFIAKSVARQDKANAEQQAAREAQ